jgi:hypothetical protein
LMSSYVLVFIILKTIKAPSQLMRTKTYTKTPDEQTK